MNWLRVVPLARRLKFTSRVHVTTAPLDAVSIVKSHPSGMGLMDALPDAEPVQSSVSDELPPETGPETFPNRLWPNRLLKDGRIVAPADPVGEAMSPDPLKVAVGVSSKPCVATAFAGMAAMVAAASGTTASASFAAFVCRNVLARSREDIML